MQVCRCPSGDHIFITARYWVSHLVCWWSHPWVLSVWMRIHWRRCPIWTSEVHVWVHNLSTLYRHISSRYAHVCLQCTERPFVRVRVDAAVYYYAVHRAHACMCRCICSYHTTCPVSVNHSSMIMLLCNSYLKSISCVCRYSWWYVFVTYMYMYCVLCVHAWVSSVSCTARHLWTMGL